VSGYTYLTDLETRIEQYLARGWSLNTIAHRCGCTVDEVLAVADGLERINTEPDKPAKRRAS
jgi:hypothetical protein